ncbi:MAG TPA: hypothetical protein PK867_13880 [Pirellulales bacterium]|nr:hypothetical protein [Pirellulales bacterium]
MAAFRNRYLAADDAGRRQARDYVERLASMARSRPDALVGHGILIYSVSMAPNEGDVVPIEMPVRVLARAIAAWDRGDFYTPEENDIIGDG